MIPFLDLKAINQQYRQALVDAATRVIDSGWYVLGQEVKAFEQDLKPKDKIKANFRIRSNEHKGRYYSEAICREIYIVEKAPIKFDKKTGELFGE